MTADPNEKTETDKADKADEARHPGGAGEKDTFPSEHDVPIEKEVPEADAADQRKEVLQREDEPLSRLRRRRDQANEADIVEQGRVVVVDEEDYR
ncbi:hypothetical protein AB0C52_03850 [Streptomyces sp. NPDC048717]|uniref:hypothetical protein n=1 Tax=Streptomyces sp. NPDC048717 TaxID=3154928 RepID=UPI0034421289